MSVSASRAIPCFSFNCFCPRLLLSCVVARVCLRLCACVCMCARGCVCVCNPWSHRDSIEYVFYSRGQQGVHSSVKQIEAPICVPATSQIAFSSSGPGWLGFSQVGRCARTPPSCRRFLDCWSFGGSAYFLCPDTLMESEGFR